MIHDSAKAKIVVFAWGNLSRGDDALGPLLAARIAAAYPEIITVEDYQLQIEHALDMAGADLVLFLDAACQQRQAFELALCQPQRDRSFTTHALSPSAVLAVYQQFYRKAPPFALIGTVSGVDFELGAPLSATASAHLEIAWPVIEALLNNPDLASWQKMLTDWQQASTNPQASTPA